MAGVCQAKVVLGAAQGGDIDEAGDLAGGVGLDRCHIGLLKSSGPVDEPYPHAQRRVGAGVVDPDGDDVVGVLLEMVGVGLDGVGFAAGATQMSGLFQVTGRPWESSSRWL